MKKKELFRLLSLVLVLGLMAGCGLGNKGKSASGADEKTDQSTSKSGKTTKASDKVDLSDMQQIGEDGYGYVHVPKLTTRISFSPISSWFLGSSFEASPVSLPK